jgi:hypothetical protein
MRLPDLTPRTIRRGVGPSGKWVPRLCHAVVTGSTRWQSSASARAVARRERAGVLNIVIRRQLVTCQLRLTGRTFFASMLLIFYFCSSGGPLADIYEALMKKPKDAAPGSPRPFAGLVSCPMRIGERSYRSLLQASQARGHGLMGAPMATVSQYVSPQADRPCDHLRESACSAATTVYALPVF